MTATRPTKEQADFLPCLVYRDVETRAWVTRHRHRRLAHVWLDVRQKEDGTVLTRPWYSFEWVPQLQAVCMEGEVEELTPDEYCRWPVETNDYLLMEEDPLYQLYDGNLNMVVTYHEGDGEPRWCMVEDVPGEERERRLYDLPQAMLDRYWIVSPLNAPFGERIASATRVRLFNRSASEKLTHVLERGSEGERVHGTFCAGAGFCTVIMGSNMVMYVRQEGGAVSNLPPDQTKTVHHRTGRPTFSPASQIHGMKVAPPVDHRVPLDLKVVGAAVDPVRLEPVSDETLRGTLEGRPEAEAEFAKRLSDLTDAELLRDCRAALGKADAELDPYTFAITKMWRDPLAHLPDPALCIAEKIRWVKAFSRVRELVFTQLAPRVSEWKGEAIELAVQMVRLLTVKDGHVAVNDAVMSLYMMNESLVPRKIAILAMAYGAALKALSE